MTSQHANFRTTIVRGLTGLLAFVCLSPLAVAADSAIADFPSDLWREIPVYHHGRVKPLDAYARQVTQKITEFNKSKPKFNLVDYYTESELNDPALAGAMEVFPEGKQRKFTYGELVYEWLVRPEKWERVPFIYLAREDVREHLGLPVTGPSGVKLNFVSPYDIVTSVKLREHLLDMDSRRREAARNEQKFEETAMDVRIYSELLFRYGVFRELSLDPSQPVLATEPLPLAGSRDRLMLQIVEASEILGSRQEERSLVNRLNTLRQIGADHPLGAGSIRLMESYAQLTEMARAGWVDAKESLRNPDPEPLLPEQPPSLDELEPLVVEFRDAATSLAETLLEQRDRANDRADLSESEYNNVKPLFQEMLVKVEQLKHVGLEMHLGLYENAATGTRFASTMMDRTGNSLQVVPALNPYALSSSRDPEDLSQPWLGLTTVLYGSDALLEPYDNQRIQAVRGSWQQAQAAYLSGEDMRPAMRNLVDSLQQLGSLNSQQRREVIAQSLDDGEIDSGILAYTAYPPADSYKIATEVRYNTLDPFMYAWIFTFIATLGFALAFAVMRRPMFWIGVTFLTIGILWSTYGFYMRVVVTGWAPVTNMYETVIFVPWVVCTLGISFLLMPLVERARLAAWRATSLPLTWEDSPLTDAQTELFSSTVWRVLNWISLLIRLPLMAAMLHFMTMRPVYDGNRPIINLTDFGDQMAIHGPLYAAVFLVVKLLVLGLSVWYLPRLVMSGLILPLFCLYDWYVDQQLGDKFEKTYQRNYYGLAAAACGTFLLCVASIAPIVDTGSNRVLNTQFSPLQPVLRSNVWLTIHVLTIVASYGAGILAWGLGWLALGYYMFGKYRAPVVANRVADGLAPAHSTGPEMSYRPPEEVFTLGQHCYRAIQVAVLLLAAGTILGGIWADVSWGRFWGWDPKEVWALVTLLIYVAILHARFAGWFNNFGLVVGTVIGFASIVGSWYGVNFLLPLFKGGEAVGLHSYGSGGKGSEIMVLGFVGLNFLALGVVALRFHLSKLAVVDENEVQQVVVRGNPAHAEPVDVQPIDSDDVGNKLADLR